MIVEEEMAEVVEESCLLFVKWGWTGEEMQRGRQMENPHLQDILGGEVHLQGD